MPQLKKWLPRVEVIFMLCMCCYVVLKATLIPFTYDEAYTFLHYVPLSARDIMRSPVAFDLANNHVLNTLLVKLMYHFSAVPFWLRLPNVLAGLLFLYSARSIARIFFGTTLLATVFFMALALNPMLMEFFALARGYGLGIAFMLFAILQLLRIVKNGPGKYDISTHLFFLSVILSVYSGFSNLLPAVLLIFLLVIIRYSQARQHSAVNRIAHTLFVPALYTGVLTYLIYKPISYLIAAKALFHGGSRNFIYDTWATMISDLAGLRPRGFEAFDTGEYYSPALVGWTSVTLILLAAALLYTGFMIRREKGPDVWLVLIPFLMLGGCITGINAQFYLLGTKLVNYRVALYLYPLFILLLFAAIKSLKPATALRTGIILGIILLVNFCSQLKITYTTEWPFDAYNKNVFVQTVKDMDKSQRKSASITSFVLMQPSFEFYTATSFSGILHYIPYSDSLQQALPTVYDYLYFPKARTSLTSLNNYQIIGAYEDSTYLLLKRN